MGTLFVVATPIGNLDDITLRAIRTLQSVDLIAAEDTRYTARLLRHLAIETPTVSYHQHNEQERSKSLLSALAAGDVALVTDAGTPAVSDPGAILVRSARDAGYRVVPVPGPSSLTAVVSASGLIAGPFTFLGFLSRTGDARYREIARASSVGFPIVIFESPNRLVDTLGDLKRALGDVDAIVARELTKLHEEVLSGTLSGLLNVFSDRKVRGEICIVVGSSVSEAVKGEPDLRGLASTLLASGMKPSKAARELAQIAGISSSDAYETVRLVGQARRDRDQDR